MNKGERQRLVRKYHKRRVKKWGYDFYQLKTTGTPCSCWLCSGDKYNRKIKHKNKGV